MGEILLKARARFIPARAWKLVSTGPGQSDMTVTPEFFDLFGNRIRKRHHERFGREIDRHTGAGHESGNRGDIDDAAGASGEHAGKVAQCQIGDRTDIEIDHLELRRARKLGGLADQPEAGIVDDDIGHEAALSEGLGEGIAAPRSERSSEKAVTGTECLPAITPLTRDSSASFRAAMASSKPSAARMSAKASPMPPEAPVTSPSPRVQSLVHAPSYRESNRLKSASDPPSRIGRNVER